MMEKGLHIHSRIPLRIKAFFDKIRSPMTARDIKTQIGGFLKVQLLGKSMTFERAQEIAEHLNRILPDDLSEDQVAKVIPSLDDNYRELTGQVYKLIAIISS
ncbi:MAG: hypothetical protein G01um101416_488 [Microgenomates group bacterium Gr01-1014_16]|nr:MAG: hypothetical protein G01um101416_488 [Microgenomates group bacterium Gr01-1014_16]